ncbi:MAG: hypothetical protein CVU77_01135 [Elusimicrobia bacterium HGW-Elusimicrobia-1]|jgi:hypothetical protein|nr:MAG: hypothetical protein CVU77_01135 [Elusimicrobia bacterium HGW-Elusimicrobia-1]
MKKSSEIISTYGIRARALLLAALSLLIPSVVAAALGARPRTEIRCVMHLHSNYTRVGNDTLEELVIKARAAGIRAIIPTDHAAARFDYRPFPFIALLSVKKEFPSIMYFSPEKYLTDIALLENKYPDMIIIPGAEVAADYSWSGSFLARDMTVRGWHRHMLVVGMEDPDDYRNLPAVGIKPGGSFNPLMLWPIFLIIAGYGSLRYHPRSGLTLFLAGVILMAGNYPFAGRHPYGGGSLKYSPLDSGNFSRPYQILADYVRSREALSFWAHPEAANREEFPAAMKISAVTEPYPELLRAISSYTGFAVFAEGYRRAGAPGGVWDFVLTEYCDGKRKSPVWAASELDYGGELFGAPVDILQNVIWIERTSSALPSKKDVLTALERGTFYALWKGKDGGIRLKDFYVEGLGGERAIFGGKIKAAGELAVYADIETIDGKTRPAVITIVADGKAVQIIETSAPSRIRHKFTPPRLSGSGTNSPVRGYVRLMIDAGYPDYIAANPVFYERGDTK